MARHLVSLLGRLLVPGFILFLLGSFPAFGQDKEGTAGGEQNKSEAANQTSDQKKETSEEVEQADQASSSPGKTNARRVDSKQNRNVSPLVQAAKSSATATTKRSFTDADLKKAKGRLIIIEGSNVREPKVPSIEERAPELFRQTTPVKAQEAAHQYARQQQIEQLKEQIRVIGEELGRLENEYLVTEEDDYRESVNQRFVQKQKELAAAQKKLEELQGGGN